MSLEWRRLRRTYFAQRKNTILYLSLTTVVWSGARPVGVFKVRGWGHTNWLRIVEAIVITHYKNLYIFPELDCSIINKSMIFFDCTCTFDYWNQGIYIFLHMHFCEFGFLFHWLDSNYGPDRFIDYCLLISIYWVSTTFIYSIHIENYCNHCTICPIHTTMQPRAALKWSDIKCRHATF